LSPRHDFAVFFRLDGFARHGLLQGRLAKRGSGCTSCGLGASVLQAAGIARPPNLHERAA